MDFSQLQLDSLIQKALTACQYSTPTPIQEKAIPIILQQQDVAASAETGSGKTAAFVLPTLHHLHTRGSAKVSRVLILTPTRELAAQIAKATDQYGKFLKPKMKVVCLVGGLPYHHQIRDLSRGADIIVATPGRLLDHVRSKRVDLSHIEMLVLDEADRMLDMGFIEDIETVVNLTPESRQTLLFSATLDKSINNIIKRLMKNPVHIDLSKQVITAENITQLLYRAQNAHHKSTMLRQFLNDENIFKAIIFSATKVNAERLAQDLCDDGFQAASLHGDLRQRVRDRTVDQLRSGKIQFLVATDVAARGIDISDITHVFNYDLPRDGEDYVHRIGRTGRAGKHGTAISFVTSSEFRTLQRIERYIGKRLSFEKTDHHFSSAINDAPKRKHDDKPRDNSKTFRKKRYDDKNERFIKPHSDRRTTSSSRDKEYSFNSSDKPKRSFNKDKPFDDNKNERFEKRRKNERFSSRNDERPAGDKPTRFSKEKSFTQKSKRFEKAKSNDRNTTSYRPIERSNESGSKLNESSEKRNRSTKKSFAGSRAQAQGGAKKFSSDKARTQKKTKKSTGSERFQFTSSPRTTTWRKKESA